MGGDASVEHPMPSIDRRRRCTGLRLCAFFLPNTGRMIHIGLMAKIKTENTTPESAGTIPVRCAFKKMVATNQLKPHPRNPNKHPESQLELFTKIVRSTGWRAPVIVSNLSGYVVAGHGRLMVAKRLGEPVVPVDYQDFATENDEIAHMLADNRLAELADLDMTVVGDLLGELDSQKFDLELAGFNTADIMEDSAVPDDVEEMDEVSTHMGTMALNGDVLFPSTLRYGIPPLKHDMFAPMPEPIKSWLGHLRTEIWDDGYYFWGYKEKMKYLPLQKTVAHFYVEDFIFEDLWSDTNNSMARLMNMKLHAAVVPNYSSGPEVAEALLIWAVYRARWVGRFMQEIGIKVIPDILLPWNERVDLMCDGLPKKIPCVSIQLQASVMDHKTESIIAFSHLLKILDPQSVAVYGSTKALEWFDELKPKELHAILIRSALDLRSEFAKGRTNKY